MRSIGVAERALEFMVKRAVSRETFGKTVAQHSLIQDWIAESRIEIDQARQYVLLVARMMDTVGKKAARMEISAIKVAAVDTANYVLDKAIQAHGAAGLSQDTPLARLWAYARTLRFADGPDEVHKRRLAVRRSPD